jgi:hypothetical protein
VGRLASGKAYTLDSRIREARGTGGEGVQPRPTGSHPDRTREHPGGDLRSGLKLAAIVEYHDMVSPLYQSIQNHFAEFESVYEDRYEGFGALGEVARHVV